MVQFLRSFLQIASQVWARFVCLLYISPFNIYIWKLDIKITQLKSCKNEFLTMQQTTSNICVWKDYWNVIWKSRLWMPFFNLTQKVTVTGKTSFELSNKQKHYIEGLVVFYRNEIRIKHMSKWLLTRHTQSTCDPLK